MKSSTLALVGLLAIGGTTMAKDFIGGEVYSKDLVKYGRWEMRMQMPKLSGSVSSFFTYEPDSWMGGETPWREIDIEALGSKPNGFQSNIITGYAESKMFSEKFHITKGEPGSGFHTYVLEWTPDSVRWSFDGVVVRTTKATASGQVGDMTDLPQTYRMNIWASTVPSWVGVFDTANLPAYQVIKYMKYASYTPGAGPNGSNFTPAWTDSFKTFDTKRWAKADWTFDENYVDFKPSNVLVKDNHLVLCLTRADAPGLLGNFPRDTATATGISASAKGAQGLRLHKAGQALEVALPANVGGWQLQVHDVAGTVLLSRSGRGTGSVQLQVPGAGLRLVSLKSDAGSFQGSLVL